MAFAILLPWQLVGVFRSPWLDLPPKAIGDGPDYETIGYSLSQTGEYAFAWDSPAWRKPYEDAERSRFSIGHYPQLERIDDSGITANRPPAYPFFLAAIYTIIPRGPIAFSVVRILAAIAIAVAASLSAWLAVRLFKHMFRNESSYLCLVSLPVIALNVLDRTLRGYTDDFLTEPWAVLGMTTWLAVLVYASGAGSLPDGRVENCKRNLRIKWLLILGGLFGAMVLLRSLFIFWLPFVAALVASVLDDSSSLIDPRLGASVKSIKLPNILAWGQRFVIFCSVAVLIVLPWGIRNCLVTRAWMPLGTQGSVSLLGGYSRESIELAGNWSPEPQQRVLDQLEKEPKWSSKSNIVREVELANACSKELVQWTSGNLYELPMLAFQRMKSHWGPYYGASLIWRVAILLGVGLIIVKLRRAAVLWLGLPIISTLITAISYETGGRFLIPLYGLLYAIAAIGCVGWLALVLNGVFSDMGHPSEKTS
jgi:hypothetical protein